MEDLCAVSMVLENSLDDVSRYEEYRSSQRRHRRHFPHGSVMVGANRRPVHLDQVPKANGVHLLKGEKTLRVMPSGSVSMSERCGEAIMHDTEDDQFGQDTFEMSIETVCFLTNYRLYFRHGTSPAVQLPFTTIAHVQVTNEQCVIQLRFDVRQYVIQFHSYVTDEGDSVSTKECCHEFCSILLRCVDPVEGASGTFAFRCGEATLAAGEQKIPSDVSSDIFDIWADYSPIDKMHSLEEHVRLDGTRTDIELAMARLGWKGGYDIEEEYRRMKLDGPDSCWKVDGANAQSALSPTYPPLLILPTKHLPAARKDQFYIKLAAYRTRGRFPALSWKNPRGHHVMLRAAQPLVGFLGARGPEDEWLIEACIQYARKMSGTRVPFCILDARSYAAALSNGYAGGGYEKTDNYPPGTTIDFLSLANVHTIAAVHSALLRSASTLSSSRDWCRTTDAATWLQHVTDLLEAAGGSESVVSKMVDQDACTLVHCTDGWDRTTQLVSLAQIMMDPYFRTVKGLRVLLEKEWLGFGHPFHARSQHAFSARYANAPPAVAAPVFLLFLTSLRQLMLQHPAAFEYKETLLWCLAKVAAGYGPFTDFMCDSEAHRERLRIRHRTRSVWDWIYARRGWFFNPFYRRQRPSANWKDDVIRPNFSTHGASLWTDYYFPPPEYKIILDMLGSDAPIHELPPMSDPALQNGSAQFHQVWMFMERRRRRALSRALEIWRSQCGWAPSTWSGQASLPSGISEEFSCMGTDDSDELSTNHDDQEEANRSSGEALGMQHANSSWVDLSKDTSTLVDTDDVLASSPSHTNGKQLRPAVGRIWRRASGLTVPWEEDVFAPNRLSAHTRVEWDEDVFVSHAVEQNHSDDSQMCSKQENVSEKACRVLGYEDLADECSLSIMLPSYQKHTCVNTPSLSPLAHDEDTRDLSSMNSYVVL